MASKISRDQRLKQPAGTAGGQTVRPRLKRRVCECCGREFWAPAWRVARFCPTRPGTIQGMTCRGMAARLRNGRTKTGRVTFRAIANTPGMEFLLDDPRILGLRRGELRFLADGQ